MSTPEPADPRRPATEETPFQGIFGRTWELELLISGGVVFGLLQLPSVLDQGFVRLESTLVGWGHDTLSMGYIYLKAIVYTLIIAFLLHLSSRAYWIGLIGLETVYPEGVRWDRLKSGPLARRAQREMLPPLPEMIVRVDRFCSSIFSLAFLVVLACLLSIFLVGLSGLVAWWVSHLLNREQVSDLFWSILFGVALLMALPGFLDKLLGHRLDPDGRTARLLDRLIRGLYRAQFGNLFASIALVLFSNPRRRSVTVLFVLVMTGAMFYLSLSHSIRRSSLWTSDAPAAQREVTPLHYQDQWPEEGPSRLAPSIQSDVILEPYLKLFIPYVPRRHDQAFASHCPSPEAKLDCAARIHQVTLDGRRLADLTFHFSVHPKSGHRGFLAYIPLNGLARGPHLLRIEPLPRKKSFLRRKDPQPYLIRFWT